MSSNGVILRGYNVSNTVAGRRQFDNSQECIAKKRQWRRHANENTLEQNASINNHLFSFADIQFFFLERLQLDCSTKKKEVNFVMIVECQLMHRIWNFY